MMLVIWLIFQYVIRTLNAFPVPIFGIPLSLQNGAAVAGSAGRDIFCSARNHLTYFKMPLCIPKGKNGWEKVSQQNCITVLKGKCPEFNCVSCEWYPLEIENCKDCQKLLFPTCVLKYRKLNVFNKYTWMEIMYTNQFGTNFNNSNILPHIVELHREIKNHKRFGNNDQEDWPLGALDANNPLGMKYNITSIPTDIKGDLCKGGKDPNHLCTQVVREAFLQYYKYKDNPAIVVDCDKAQYIENSKPVVKDACVVEINTDQMQDMATTYCKITRDDKGFNFICNGWIYF